MGRCGQAGVQDNSNRSVWKQWWKGVVSSVWGKKYLCIN
jgi:hypothetical protein